MSDCNALLASRDTLASDATLNWTADRSIYEWEGVNVGGDPRRVHQVSLKQLGLNGVIPAGLSELTALLELRITDIHLSGGLPAELGRLKELRELWLVGNGLTGKFRRGLVSLLA